MSGNCSIEDCARALQAARRPKYGNRKTAYAGRTYDSAAEAAYARELDLRLKAGDISAWTPQYAVPLIVNGRRICVYRADFRVILADGTEELIEVKGYETREWKLKRRLLEALRPDLVLRVVQR